MAYVDTSALAKLLLDEPESPALRTALHGRRVISSEIAAAELLRTVARRAPGYEPAALALLRAADLVPVSSRILLAAARLLPATLGTLDAVHLGTALLLGPSAAPFLTYDRRLARAAGTAGLDVLHPR